ncbi:MAG TPA: hypothetical protein VHI13_09535 [Candidatus Kapabacteria bacterium]|nr:hypothetical protein [Candidatus Kapabacteria bacterium]
MQRHIASFLVLLVLAMPQLSAMRMQASCPLTVHGSSVQRKSCCAPRHAEPGKQRSGSCCDDRADCCCLTMFTFFVSALERSGAIANSADRVADRAEPIIILPGMAPFHPPRTLLESNSGVCPDGLSRW